MNWKLPFVLAVSILSLTLIAVAQVQNENLANGIIAARKKEAAQLQLYTWTCRTEITQNGTLQDLRLDQVTVNPNGTLNRSLLNDQQGQLPNGFFRKGIAENKRKDLEKYVSGLRTLIDQYTLPSAGAVINYLATAQVQPVALGGVTYLQVTGSGVVVPGDTFTMTVDGQTLTPTSMNISTTDTDGNPVTITASFRKLRPGPNHLQYATIELPAKNTTVTLHNFDYFLND